MFEAGTTGSEMYFISSGVVDILRPGNLGFQIGQGDFFGEIALFQEVPRTASVRAASAVTLRVLTREDCYQVMECKAKRWSGGGAGGGLGKVLGVGCIYFFFVNLFVLIYRAQVRPYLQTSAFPEVRGSFLRLTRARMSQNNEKVTKRSVPKWMRALARS